MRSLRLLLTSHYPTLMESAVFEAFVELGITEAKLHSELFQTCLHVGLLTVYTTQIQSTLYDVPDTQALRCARLEAVLQKHAPEAVENLHRAIAIFTLELL